MEYLLSPKQCKLAMQVSVSELKPAGRDLSGNEYFSLAFTSTNRAAVEMATRLMRSLPSYAAQYNKARKVWVVRTELGELLNRYLPLGERTVLTMKAAQRNQLRARLEGRRHG